VAVDDDRTRPVELVGALTQLAERDVDGPGKVLVCELLRRQHLDELGTLGDESPHVFSMDFDRHWGLRGLVC
jgi:hypothetical protein